jgi:hypothetical protein
VPAAATAALRAARAPIDDTEDASQGERIVALLREAERLLRDEATIYAPIFAPHLPQSEQLAAAALQACLAQDVLPWLDAGTLGHLLEPQEESGCNSITFAEDVTVVKYRDPPLESDEGKAE